MSAEANMVQSRPRSTREKSEEAKPARSVQKTHAQAIGDVQYAPASKKRGGSLPVSLADYASIFHSSPAVRVGLIRDGVPAAEVKRLQERLDMSQAAFLQSMKLSTATLNRKVSRQENLSPEDSERVIGMAKLIGQVQEMVRQSGEPKGFDPAKWLAGWLQQTVPALGGSRPIDFMDTMEGQGIIADLLARMQSGAYA
jgi:putative toxin-antitoxin system antitoxin component (TIGR02293 family)